MKTSIVRPDDTERGLLRDSVRGFLLEHWPANRAVQRQADRAALQAMWYGLARQGLLSLGADPEQGGLREATLVVEELGRAACPVPFADAVLCNLSSRPGISLPGGLIPDVQSGVVMPLFVWAADWQAGTGACLLPGDGGLSGHLPVVDGATAATHLLMSVEDGLVLRVVSASDPGVRVLPARALGLDGLARVELDDCAGESIAVTAGAIADQDRLHRLCRLARAYGAARRAFELVCDHAKERRQFGRPIGSFQAVQHKLANALIELETTRLLIDKACRAFDDDESDWRYFVDAAQAFSAVALRKVSLETQHMFGAIGYAEEHEAPRHFRRVHLDTLSLEGGRGARQALADALLRQKSPSLPKYDLGQSGNRFRQQVADWLAEHWSGDRKAAFDARPFHDREFDAAFARDVGTTGWIGLAWPVTHGGQARAPNEQIAFMEEMERVEAPRIGAAIQSTALMLFGTEAQQRRYLPEILRGEAMHGMGYSEPDAGSDLAALKTRAQRDGDDWVINGQKIWTTTWWGQYMFLAARTDRDARPAHAGISMFIVPMSSPGIEIRPATTMYDGTFSNIFYDNVRVPADALLGPVNGGWQVLTSALATERGLVGGGIVLKVARLFERLCAEIKTRDVRGTPLSEDLLVKDRIGDLAAQIEAGRQLMMECARLAGSGPTPAEVGAMSKVFSGELMERFGEAALEILGMSATLSQHSPGCIAQGRFEQALRHSLMWVISIGTNEIQRTVIAQRGLGLPKT